jgi:DNA integrity scanning protein DisA with diadenylate cyclase activity
VIVGRNGRIIAARCILRVTENDQLPAQLGLRHRSAIGLTEVSDAVVLVVSEETGQISLVVDGKIYRDLTLQEMRKVSKALLSNSGWIESSVDELLEQQGALSA